MLSLSVAVPWVIADEPMPADEGAGTPVAVQVRVINPVS
jgi:hypothetical protein